MVTRTGGDVECIFKELRGWIGDDGKCGDQVQQQHDLHSQAHVSVGDAQYDIGLACASERPVAAEGHWEVDQKQDWKEKMTAGGDNIFFV